MSKDKSATPSGAEEGFDLGFYALARQVQADWEIAATNEEEVERFAVALRRTYLQASNRCVYKLQKVANQCEAGGHTIRAKMFRAIAKELQSESQSSDTSGQWIPPDAKEKAPLAKAEFDARAFVEGIYLHAGHSIAAKSFFPKEQIHCSCGADFDYEGDHFRHAEKARIDEAVEKLNALLQPAGKLGEGK